jgi:flagellar biosynthesis component FlhA
MSVVTGNPVTGVVVGSTTSVLFGKKKRKDKEKEEENWQQQNQLQQQETQQNVQEGTQNDQGKRNCLFF